MRYSIAALLLVAVALLLIWSDQMVMGGTYASHLYGGGTLTLLLDFRNTVKGKNK